MPADPTTTRKRFEKFVYRIPGGCHIWTGHTTAKGYGRFRYEGKWIPAHRAAWLLAGREWTEDRPLILHNCPGGDWPGCVNEDHLWDGTHQDNNRDKARKRRGTSGPLPYGVQPVPGCSTYTAAIRVEGTLRHLGNFKTIKEASMAAENARTAAHLARVALGEVEG